MIATCKKQHKNSYCVVSDVDDTDDSQFLQNAHVSELDEHEIRANYYYIQDYSQFVAYYIKSAIPIYLIFMCTFLVIYIVRSILVQI
jgi:hypothetical protein